MMSKIRTKETYEGPVRSIDRAAIISKMMRQTSLRTREGIRQTGSGEQEQNESSYVGDRTIGMVEGGAFLAKDAAIKGFKEARHIGKYRSKSKERALNERYEQAMAQVGTDVIIIDPEKEYEAMAGSGSKFANMANNIYQNGNEMYQTGTIFYHNGKNIYQNGKKSPINTLFDTGNAPEIHTKQIRNLTNSVSFQTEKGEDILKRQYRTKKAREAFRKNSERSGKKILASLKRTVASEKTITVALAVAGSIALISIIVCTFFGSAFYILGDDGDPDFVPEEFIGIGDAGIVEVAASQVGNVGGEPYWSWYGFSGRVEWCACFVSWCANQCGYIEAGIIPKFAGVGTGIEWFQDRHQWQKRGYKPQPGDIIFFDWEGNGYGSHVGIVESSDDLYVYTIEGNTSDSCKRRTYFLHSSVVMGYGIPAYPVIDGPDNENTKTPPES